VYPENGLELKVVYDADGFNQVRVAFVLINPKVRECALRQQQAASRPARAFNDLDGLLLASQPASSCSSTHYPVWHHSRTAWY
jgi:hypothetical protein